MAHETKIVVRVEASLKQVCERIAQSRDETLSQVLRRALRDYAAQHAQLELPTKKMPASRPSRPQSKNLAGMTIATPWTKR